MKKLLLGILFTCTTCLCFGQKNLISYEDLKYLLHNTLQEGDTFLSAKGYKVEAKNDKAKTREYSMQLQGNTHVMLTMRADGKKQYMEIETDDVTQYNLINNSISQYINKEGSIGDVQTYWVKNLCNIYITVTDTKPYNPLKKDYVMQIVPDKHVVAYD
jgi:predicted house-cleaning NTP pyrophosphatase (Maf/HAM1 superfamily)